MSKNKFIKKLLIAGLCALTATATIGTVACKPSGGGNPEGTEPPAHTEHTWVDGQCTGCDKTITDTSADDINNDESVANYEDVTGTPATVANPKVPDYTGPAAALVEGTVDVVSEFNATDREVGTYTAEWSDGIFTLPVKTTIRTRTRGSYLKSVQLKDDDGALVLNAVAPGTLTLALEDGSSKPTPGIKLIHGGTTTPVDYATGGVKNIDITISEAGTYKIQRDSSKNGTTDIYYAKFSTQLENTSVTGITVVNSGKADYLVGQQLDCTDIAVTAAHSNGSVSGVSLENVEIDATGYHPETPGTYSIGVTYNLAGNLGGDTSISTTYDVNVYAFDDFTLGFNQIVKESKNTTAGNGVYANHAVRQFYFVGDTFSYDGLSITAKGKLPTGGTKDFLLDPTQAVVTDNSTATAGKKSVKVSYTAYGLTKAKGYNVYVAEKGAELANADTVLLAVNPKFSTATVGVKNEAGAYRFKTVQQAMDFINNAGLKNSAQKIIYLAEGNYWEKIEVTQPNVTIIGAGRDKTKLEYDSLYGIKDESGYEHTTDSTATLNIRESAINFTIKGVTVSNAYNSLAYFNEKLGPDYPEHRALAILIQSDKFVMDDCSLLGYQDTIELFTGRQIIKNSYISGTTDFIFGTNNTTYFYNCEIHSITNGKTDGGYITAFKGCNKGEGDYVTYGAVFDKCHFTADSTVVTNKNTAIGRPWGAYAAVAVINSEIDGHVSTTGFSGTASKNLRYVAMSGVNPTAATVKFVEYNNTGDGAVTAAVSGMKMLTETEAAKYNDFTVIFAKTNSKVTYTDVWQPEL